MSGHSMLKIWQSGLCLTVCGVSFLAGCNGKVPTWNELTSQPQPAPTQQTTTIQSPTAEDLKPKTIVSPVVEAVKPTAEEIVAEFKKLKPGQVDNSAIAMLASLDEGLE